MINKYQLNRKKEYNIGIGILRVCLSFMVICDHLYSHKKFKKYVYFLYYHIPTFFLLSFFYTFNKLGSFNIKKIKTRFERLTIPYFSWCIIYWIFKNIYFYLLNKRCRHSFIDFMHNLLNGHIFNGALWFQNILILLTVTFLIVIFLFKIRYIYILVSLALLAYVLQYKNLNYYFFIKNFPVDYFLSLGRFAEGFPNAVTGLCINSFGLIAILKNRIRITIIISLVILVFITKLNIFSHIKSFKYGGIRLNIGAICIFFIFYLFPFKGIKNELLVKIIIQLTNYTGGIYFIHNLIGRGYILKKSLSILEIKKCSLLHCIITYFISHILCIFGTKIFGKTIFKHLFA